MKQIHFESYLSHSYRLREDELEGEEIKYDQLLSMDREVSVQIINGTSLLAEKQLYRAR